MQEGLELSEVLCQVGWFQVVFRGDAHYLEIVLEEKVIFYFPQS